MPLLRRERCQSNDSVDFNLYLITDRHQTNGRALTEVVRAALQGGVRAVQLREKDLPDHELLALAQSLRRLTSEFGARLLINRRADICLAVGADGVHLGADGMTIAEARRELQEHRLIGYSAHSLEQACAAEAAGASFITFGPVFATPSKAAFGEPAGVEHLAETCNRLTIPVFALGGIKRDSIAAVMSAGAHGISLISAVITAADPAKEAQMLLSMIEH
jgi:thiamine-phosphate pyrophosphorylase